MQLYVKCLEDILELNNLINKVVQILFTTFHSNLLILQNMLCCFFFTQELVLHFVQICLM